MRLDPYKHKERYLNWKEKVKRDGKIIEVSDENSKLLLRYIDDMELGLNVASRNKKGARNPITLNNLKQRMCFIANLVEKELKISNLTSLTEEDIFRLFNNMKNGTIKRVDGTDYQSVGDYIRVFKAFWHWWIKSNKKKGIDSKNITNTIFKK
jgi:hypothetical protein